MTSFNCSLSILVARTDLAFMMQTIPHLVKTCHFDFMEKALIIDTAPLSDNFRKRPGIGTLEQLRACCQRLLDDGIVDKLIDINYSEDYRKKVYQKHFGCNLRAQHDFRGYPILGSVFSLEAAESDYVLHFDSDMLLYQDSEHSWIQKGIHLLNSQPEVMFVSPLSGPPSEDNVLKQRVPYQKNLAGFYSFKDFTSRKFLVNRKKLEQILPLKPSWIFGKHRLMNYFGGKNEMWSWEVMVSNRLKETDYVRADLDSHKAWTLHTPDHGSNFIQHLPDVISKVESGQYPMVQSGEYNLQLDAWL